MHTSQRGFTPIIILIVLAVLAASGSGFIMYRTLHSKNNFTQSQISVPDNVKKQHDNEIHLNSENETIKILPGQGNIILADGESRIKFGSFGRPDSVPDIVFGENYSRYIHKINFLPLKVGKGVSFYNKGYIFTLKNLKCDTKIEHSDVSVSVVSSCDVYIASIKADARALPIISHEVEFNISTGFDRRVGDQNSALVYVKVPNFSISAVDIGEFNEKVLIMQGSETSPSDSPVHITVITAFGIDTIQYYPKDIFQKQTKKTTIGPLEVKSEVKDFNCSIVNLRGYKSIRNCKEPIIKLSIIGIDNSPHLVKLINY